MWSFFQAISLASMLSICWAQTTPPAFEVTTIRRDQSGAVQSAVFFQPGRFVAENATVKMLIAYAYAVKDVQISGGPSWMDSERFNITAKEDESVSLARQKLPWKQYREQLGLMVQAMLADRFGLKVVHRPKEASILALVTTPGGSTKLVRSARDIYEADFRGHRGELTATGVSIAQLADFLSWMPEVGSRKIVDQTGIEGTFDLTLRWSWESSDAGGPAETVQPDAPSMFTAVREQLGLKLQPTKGLLDYLVVEQVEQPSEN